MLKCHEQPEVQSSDWHIASPEAILNNNSCYMSALLHALAELTPRRDAELNADEATY